MNHRLFKKTYNLYFVALSLICFSSFAYAAPPPVIMFSDLISAPKVGWNLSNPDKGAIVTIWGRNFGSIRGNNYVTVNGVNLTADSDYKDDWAEINNPVPFLQSITFQLNNTMISGDGEISVTVDGEESNRIPFRINTIGFIYFIDVKGNDEGSGSFSDPWSNLSDFIDVMSPGDVGYFRSGLYNERYNGGKSNIWVRSSEASGTRQDPIGFIGYPNEVAMFDSWTNGDVSNFNKSILVDSHNITVAKLSTNAYSRGIQVGRYGRIIGNDAIGVQQLVGGAGIIHVGADGVKILGNAVHGGRSGDRLDHSIYVDGCQDIEANEIAYNYSYDNLIDRGPHLVDNHQVNRCSPDVYQKSNHWHNNVVSCEADPSRGIGIYDLSWDIGEANEPGIAYVYNNILAGCGDGWHGAMYHSNGHAVFYNNVLYNNQGKGIQLFDSSTVLSSKAINNIIVNATTDEYVTGTRHTFDSNAYFNGPANSIPASDLNAVTSDPMITVDTTAYHTIMIHKDSPLIDSGSSVVSSIVTNDFFGSSQTGSHNIGAVEEVGSDTILSSIGPVENPDPTPVINTSINAGDTWKYFKGTVHPGNDWSSLNFNDEAWLEGPSGIGYGDGDDETELLDMEDAYLTVYARKVFHVEDASEVSGLVLSMIYDDGFIVYLNGQEVRRVNMPSGAVDHNTEATTWIDPTDAEQFDLSTFTDSLVSGTNMLGIEIHNSSLSSSDISLIPELSVEIMQDGEPEPIPNGDGDECSANCLIENIIFETDFRNDASFYATHQQSSWTEVVANTPAGFDGALIEGKGYIKGMPGEGVGDSVALKFMWDPKLGQPVSQLYKHLTGDESTGYDEVYIRYQLRLPNKFKVGIPGIDDIPYWKFGRLWQNTGVAPGDKWTENRSDSFYSVWNFGGTDMWGVDAGATFGANSGANLSKGSAGGERFSNDYYIGKTDYTTVPGHFRHVGNGAWDFDSDTRMLKNNTPQTWHTIEWRFKLSSSNTSGDGIFQMWFDGVEQVPVKIGQGGGVYDPPLQPNANPTASHGSGYNFFVMFDNMAFWNKNWDDPGVEGGIYVNDVVISRTRIGHDYVVDMAPPAN